jgi:hypothetical protein
VSSKLPTSRTSLLLCFLMLSTSLAAFSAPVVADEHSGFSVWSDVAPGPVILYDTGNGTVVDIAPDTPFNISLDAPSPGGEWRMMRLIDGVPQLAILIIDGPVNATDWVTAPLGDILLIEGVAHLDILGPIAPMTPLNATWRAGWDLPDTVGTDLLPEPHMGVRAQIDRHLGNGDGNLDANESAAFAALMESNGTWSDSEVAGCCLYDKTSLTVVDNGSNAGLATLTATPPASGLVDDNSGRWGWNETADLTGQGDGRSTRLLWLPVQGDIRDRTDLRITLPEPWEYRYSPQLEVIDGVADDFTIHRGHVMVAGNLTVALGTNDPPSASYSAADRNLPILPHAELTTIEAQCTDSTIGTPASEFTLVHDGTELANTTSSNLTIDAPTMGVGVGEWVNLTLVCTDHQGLFANFSDLLYLDGQDPTAVTTAVWNHADISDPVTVDMQEHVIEVWAGSTLVVWTEGYDDAPWDVDILWESNKSLGWNHHGLGTMSFSDLFNQGPDVNGQHLSVEERHLQRQPTEWSLDLTLTDGAGNQVTDAWTLRVLDRTAPTPKLALTVNGVQYSEIYRPVPGDSVVVSLEESYDDLDAIESLTWEITFDETPLSVGSTWADVKGFTLADLQQGRHNLMVKATDSAGNVGTNMVEILVDPLGVMNYEIVEVALAIGGSPDEPASFDVTIQNTGSIAGTVWLCHAEQCSDPLQGVVANVDGPTKVTHRFSVAELASGTVVIFLHADDNATESVQEIRYVTDIDVAPEIGPWILLLAVPALAGLLVLKLATRPPKDEKS